MAVWDETSELETVIVGTTIDRGPLQFNNATITLYANQGTAPTDSDIANQVKGFCSVLEEQGIEVLRPQNVNGVLQLFVRDLGFVVGDTFIWSNLKKEKRRLEQQGLWPIIDSIPGLRTVQPPSHIAIEGGDIVLVDGKVLVGIGDEPEHARTKQDAVAFLRATLHDVEVVPIKIRASDDKSANPKDRVLHLDCAFQPVGSGYAICFLEGFAGPPEAILDLFGEKKLIRVSGDEMFDLWPNLFSLSPSKIVSAPTFGRLNGVLREIGFEILEVPYHEIAKLGGLFRCSTLPLRRRQSRTNESTSVSRSNQQHHNDVADHHDDGV